MRAKQSALLLLRVASLAVTAKSNAVEPSDFGSRVAHVDNQQANRGAGASFLLWKHLRSIGTKNRTSSSSGGKTPSLKRENSASDSSEYCWRRTSSLAVVLSWIRSVFRSNKKDCGVRRSCAEQRSSSWRSTNQCEAAVAHRLLPISWVC